MRISKLIVLSNAVAGKEAEYETWYAKQHIPDVLQIAGFLSARNYKISASQRTGLAPSPYAYFAEYEINPDLLPLALRELEARRGTSLMPLTESQSENKFVYIYDQLPEA